MKRETSGEVASTRPRVVVFVKRTAFEAFGQTRRVQGLLKHGDARAKSLKENHDAHHETVAEVEEALSALRVSYTFDDAGSKKPIVGVDLVVSIGGDGTLLLASQRIGAGTPIVGINSAPGSSVGFFCAGRKGSAASVLRKALHGLLHRSELTRMRVDQNGKALTTRVLNDALFCAPSPAATSRYRLAARRSDGRLVTETQRSSGLWVGPAAGSTAAQRSAGGRVLPFTSKKIQYVVREPYRPLGAKLQLVRGIVREGDELSLEIDMDQGIVFLDGPRVCAKVFYGDVLTMRRSDEPLSVLGLSRHHRGR